jgi:hypothetical protein
METPYRRVPLTLPPDLYERLEKWAEAEDRDVVQQARAILRRALEVVEKPEQPEAEACPQ